MTHHKMIPNTYHTEPFVKSCAIQFMYLQSMGMKKIIFRANVLPTF